MTAPTPPVSGADDRDTRGGAASRRQLRRSFRQIRRHIEASRQRAHATAVARSLAANPMLLCHHRFALYWAADGELDTAPLIARLFGYGKQVALPVLDGRRLVFVRYRPETPLLANRFGIPEPHGAGSRPLPIATLGVVFLPLVAFDDHGYRLGMGGGFYDRTFAHDRPGDALHHWRRPLLVGLAHQAQATAAVPRATWDVPMDGVLTERGYRGFTERGKRYGVSW